MSDRLNCRDCSAFHRSLFAEIPDAELIQVSKEKTQLQTRLCGGKTSRGASQLEPIFSRDEEVRGLYCLGTTRAKVTQAITPTQGSERLVRIARLGDTVGHRSILIRSHYRGTATPVESGYYCLIPRETVLRLLGRYSTFALGLLTKMASELLASDERNSDFQEKNVRERLASVLMQLASEHGVPLQDGSVRIEMSLKRGEIADLVGAAEENVIRLITEFKQSGILSEQSRRLCVLSISKLESLSRSGFVR